MYTHQTYMRNTRANFKGCKVPKRKPDYESASGSRYWHGHDSKGIYIIRESNHWSYIRLGKYKQNAYGCGKVASCFWTITDYTEMKESAEGMVIPVWYTGKAYLKDFRDNPTSIRFRRKKEKWARRREQQAKRLQLVV